MKIKHLEGRELDVSVALALGEGTRTIPRWCGDLSVPLYSEDLNSAHRAQLDCIKLVGWGKYGACLLDVLGWTLREWIAWEDTESDEDGNIKEGSWNSNFEAYRRIATARAEEICYAIILALEV